MLSSVAFWFLLMLSVLGSRSDLLDTEYLVKSMLGGSLCLTAREDGKVYMASCDHTNKLQTWVRDTTWNSLDAEGYGAFMLVNNGTKQVLWHGTLSLSAVHTMPVSNDASVLENYLWSMREVHPGAGYYIRVLRDISLNLDINHANNAHNRNLILHGAHGGPNQLWQFVNV